MAYTDFPNVIRAPLWSGPSCGVFTSSTPSSLDYGSLGFLSPLPTWNSGWYGQLDPSDPGPPYTPESPAVYQSYSYLFVATGLLRVNDLYIDSTPLNSDNVAVSLYGSDGQPLLHPTDPLQSAYLITDWNYWATSPNVTVLDEDTETFQTRRVSRVMWADTSVNPTVYTPLGLDGVKAIAISGAGDYPQGRPTKLYGIYGPELSSEVPFWTEFSGSPDTNNLDAAFNWPFSKQRLTELF